MKVIKIAGFKKLAAGMCLVAVINPAQADILTIPVVSGSTDLILTAWDSTAKVSYATDLNLSLQGPQGFASQAATSNFTWDLDTSFASFVASGDPITYSIAAANQVRAVNANGNNDALLLSYQTGNAGNNNATDLSFTNLGINQGNVINFITALSGVGSETVTNPLDAAYFNTTFWGVSQGAGSRDGTTTVGGGGLNELSVYYQYATPVSATKLPAGYTPSVQTLYPGYFSINLGNDTLNWSASAPATVPVPGAVWLFLGGVLTMLGFQKRKAM